VSRVVCLLVNPAAGGGRARAVAPEAESALRARGVEVRREETIDLEHARALACAAARRGEAVVAVSGDGLIGTLADALRGERDALIGVIPGGRGNDLARVLGIPDDPAGAAGVIADGFALPIDLGIVQGSGPRDRERAFVGIASAGFDSDANRIANEAPSWLGGMVYAYGALRALAAWKPARFELELDPPGRVVSISGYSIGAANSKTYGGGMRAAPDAMLDDGLLDVMALGSVSKPAFLTRILPRVFKGTHVAEPAVELYRAREIALSADRPFTMYADGDPIGELPVRVRAEPAAIRMLVPRASPPVPALAGQCPIDHGRQAGS
jgi:YegS/Rv2252/BmrU family lipid kinase